MNSRRLRWLHALGAALAAGFLIVSLNRAWIDVKTNLEAVNGSNVFGSFACLCATFFLTVEIWRRMLRDLGDEVSYSSALQIWSFSNLGRYIPGKVWQVVGAVVVGREFGVRASSATAASVGSFALSVGSGALVGGGLAASAGVMTSATIPAAFLGAVGLTMLLFAPRVLSSIVFALKGREGVDSFFSLPRSTVLSWCGFLILVWLLQGFAFFLFATAFTEILPGMFPAICGVYAFSYVMGLVAVFAPGGIGIREGVLGATLTPLLGLAGPGHLIAIGTRLWSILAEGVVLLVALGVRWTLRRRAK